MRPEFRVMTTPSIEAIAAGLSEAERVTVLAMGDYEDFGFRHSKHLAERAKISSDEARRSARALVAKNLAVFERGLMSEDGKAYGSGWALNALGLALRAHLGETA